MLKENIYKRASLALKAFLLTNDFVRVTSFDLSRSPAKSIHCCTRFCEGLVSSRFLAGISMHLGGLFKYNLTSL